VTQKCHACALRFINKLLILLAVNKQLKHELEYLNLLAINNEIC